MVIGCRSAFANPMIIHLESFPPFFVWPSFSSLLRSAHVRVAHNIRARVQQMRRYSWGCRKLMCELKYAGLGFTRRSSLSAPPKNPNNNNNNNTPKNQLPHVLFWGPRVCGVLIGACESGVVPILQTKPVRLLSASRRLLRLGERLSDRACRPACTAADRVDHPELMRDVRNVRNVIDKSDLSPGTRGRLADPLSLSPPPPPLFLPSPPSLPLSMNDV